MTVRIGAVVLQVRDVERASRFWRQALGYVAHPRNPAFLAPADGVGPELHLDVDDRSHLDLWSVAADDVEAEVGRLVALGAEPAPWDYPEDADFVVLRDPEGTLFCVVTD